jgi:hypothetical protein
LGWFILFYLEFVMSKKQTAVDYFGNVWIKAEKDVWEYPIGTKFKALMGGHWIRVERGFKWCTGSTFGNVGGDWTGEVCLP